MKTVYIVMDSSDNTGSRSILGVFSKEDQAKIALADYVLGKKTGGIDYIEMEEFTVQEEK